MLGGPGGIAGPRIGPPHSPPGKIKSRPHPQGPAPGSPIPWSCPSASARAWPARGSLGVVISFENPSCGPGRSPGTPSLWPGPQVGLGSVARACHLAASGAAAPHAQKPASRPGLALHLRAQHRAPSIQPLPLAALGPRTTTTSPGRNPDIHSFIHSFIHYFETEFRSCYPGWSAMA